MNPPRNGARKHKRYGIDVAADRYVSVNGPAMDRLLGWGAKRDSDGLEVHMHPPIAYEVHYRASVWVAIFAFNGAATRGAFNDDPLSDGRRARGSACLIPPGTRVRIIQEEPQEFLALLIPPDRFAGIADGAAGCDGWERKIVHSHGDPALGALCGEVRRVMINEPSASAAYLGAVCESATTRLISSGLIRAEACRDQGGGREMLAPAVRRRITDEIERRLHRKISVSELAQSAGLSRSHFTRAFTESFGESPGRYLLGRRIGRAREMLRDTDRPVTEIALACGFADHAHFSTAFRKEFGLAPRAYRETAERG